MTLPRFDKINIEITNVCISNALLPAVIRTNGMMDLVFSGTLFSRSHLTPVSVLSFDGRTSGSPPLSILLISAVAVCGFSGYQWDAFTRSRPKSFVRHSGKSISPYSFNDNFPTRDQVISPTDLRLRNRLLKRRTFTLISACGTSTSPLGPIRAMKTSSNASRNVLEFSRPQIDVRARKGFRINRLYLHFDTEFTWPALDLPV